MRICYDKIEEISDENKLFFHCWAGLSEIPFAVVETRMGFIKFIEAENLMFEESYKRYIK